ncbi:MAG: prolipoprotein diacylglyceryl transferase [Puniceicoccales bacterium]|jgi:phosphatidylglycerol:prolipoprotein diacylglycerol transferase|nr:prolipoprotein diacylglyceryl transferase [Puniceicoccales bacterium]
MPFAAISASPVTTPSPTPGYWVHDLDPFVVRFADGIGVRWYGLAYVVGFCVAVWLLALYYKRGKSPLNSDNQSVFMLAMVAGVLLGGRLGYVLGYMLPRGDDLFNPWYRIFNVAEGGMASHGGIIGVWLALIFAAWKTKTHFWRLMDISATLAPAGVFFGRIANFVNGELYGRETDVSWAVIFRSHDGTFLLPRHPSQLYEAALEGLLMLLWTQWRLWRFKLPDGQLVGEAIIAYTLVRIFGEIFREPDAGVSLVLGLSRGQFYSLFMLLFGVAVILLARRRNVFQPIAAPAPAQKNPTNPS